MTANAPTSKAMSRFHLVTSRLQFDHKMLLSSHLSAHLGRVVPVELKLDRYKPSFARPTTF